MVWQRIWSAGIFRHGDRVAFLFKNGMGICWQPCLGILKAGAVYLPLDPALPKERICYMLENAEAKLLLCSNEVKLPGEIPLSGASPCL